MTKSRTLPVLALFPLVAAACLAAEDLEYDVVPFHTNWFDLSAQFEPDSDALGIKGSWLSLRPWLEAQGFELPIGSIAIYNEHPDLVFFAAPGEWAEKLRDFLKSQPPDLDFGNPKNVEVRFTAARVPAAVWDPKWMRDEAAELKQIRQLLDRPEVEAIASATVISRVSPRRFGTGIALVEWGRFWNHFEIGSGFIDTMIEPELKLDGIEFGKDTFFELGARLSETETLQIFREKEQFGGRFPYGRGRVFSVIESDSTHFFLTMEPRVCPAHQRDPGPDELAAIRANWRKLGPDIDFRKPGDWTRHPEVDAEGFSVAIFHARGILRRRAVFRNDDPVDPFAELGSLEPEPIDFPPVELKEFRDASGEGKLVDVRDFLAMQGIELDPASCAIGNVGDDLIFIRAKLAQVDLCEAYFGSNPKPIIAVPHRLSLFEENPETGEFALLDRVSCFGKSGQSNRIRRSEGLDHLTEFEFETVIGADGYTVDLDANVYLVGEDSSGRPFDINLWLDLTSHLDGAIRIPALESHGRRLSVRIEPLTRLHDPWDGIWNRSPDEWRALAEALKKAAESPELKRPGKEEGGNKDPEPLDLGFDDPP